MKVRLLATGTCPKFLWLMLSIFLFSTFIAYAGTLTYLSASCLAIEPLTPTTIYSGTRSGVFKSTDGGGNWTPVKTGLTDLPVASLAIDPLTPDTVYAGTQYGGGIQE